MLLKTINKPFGHQISLDTLRIAWVWGIDIMNIESFKKYINNDDYFSDILEENSDKSYSSNSDVDEESDPESVAEKDSDSE